VDSVTIELIPDAYAMLAVAGIAGVGALLLAFGVWLDSGGSE
jgi:hypothetical protein